MPDSNSNTVIKKRKYSRGGCVECKRRKMKCDEEKPFCLNCTRLRKTCVYPDKKGYSIDALPGKRNKVNDVESKLPEILEGHESVHVNGHDATLSSSLTFGDSHQLALGPGPAQAAQSNSMLGTLSSPALVFSPGGIPNYQTPMLNYNSSLKPYNSPTLLPYLSHTSRTTPYLPQIHQQQHQQQHNTQIGERHSPPGIPSSNSLNNLANAANFAMRPDYQTSTKNNHINTINNNNNNNNINNNGGGRSFGNSIQDIVTPSDPSSIELSNKGVIPGGDGVGVGGTNINLRDIFDEASLFVNDLNELVSLDITDLPTNSKHDAAPSMNAVSGGRGGSGDTASVYSNFSTDSQEAHTFHLDEFTNLIGNHYQHASGSTSPVLQLSRNRDIKRQDFEVSNSSLVQQTIQKNNLSGPHASYLQILTNTELSYHMYPFASSVESNEVVHILLEYLIHCPYLLTLLLAISATLQYNQTGKLIHDLSRQKYVSACLTLLSKEFNTSGEGKNNVTLANGIERLLLTVLVLTTNFTASANKDDYGRDNSNNNKDGILNSWKTHLKGAKDLLIRYSNVKSQSKDVTGVSPGLAVAKIWFFAIECLAGLMSPMGGSLTRRNLGDNRENPDGKYKLFEDTGFFDYESNPEYHDTLVKIGMLTPSENFTNQGQFNLFLGFTIEVVKLFERFIKSLDLIRRSDEVYVENANAIAEIMQLIHIAKTTTIIPGIPSSASYVIPIGNRAHPAYSLPDKITLPSAVYAKQMDHTAIDNNDTALYYSWADISQQIRVDGVYLRILLLPHFLGLPRGHRSILELRDRIIGYMFFVKRKPNLFQEEVLLESEHFYLPASLFDIRCVMIQTPFRFCIQFLTDDIEFERLQLYFEGLVKLGNGSALRGVELAKRGRERASRRGKREDSTEIIDGIDSQEEIIAFS